jgi:peptidoglycan/xylan/chitin deacetylase (PgdA/CDA1 family)
MTVIRTLTACFAAFLLTAAAPAHKGTVALTFDDLPVFGSFKSAADGAQVTDRLLDGLQRQHWKATGFVNEVQLEAPDKPQRVALLKRWLDAGMDLGNHTYSHLSLNTTTVDAYIADIARDEAETAPLLRARGRRERWFRYPYLETGRTLASRDQVAGWLARHGYRVAPVTMENSDWQFSAPYDDAMARGDAQEAERIRGQYITFTRDIVAWYMKAGRALFRRQPAFVFLLHASRLNAASVDALAAILRDAKLRVVPLDVAMRDPGYRTADGYVGPDGNEWLERWALTLHRDLPFESIPKVPRAIVERDERLEAASDPHPGAPAPASKP